ncbi:MAG: wax ester/triacylglycerol synthase family O-acyltransferase [Candidatus Accumulibacter sp. UW26]|jgi:diacylglycerol O-acyltransferase
MTARERISPVDHAWLRMDRPENLMQILGVMIFADRIDAERFRRTVAQRLRRYRRFRQIARLDNEASWWIDDPDFDIDAHVRHSLLPAPGGKGELQKFVAEMASTPLNPARARWEFNLVDTADGSSALVVRIHHAIADGIALLGVIDSLTDDRVDAPEAGDLRTATSQDNEDATSDENDAFWRTILAPLTDLALASIHVGGHLWGQYLGLRNDPATLLDYARAAGSVAREVSRLALMNNDSPTRYKGKPGTIKRVAWSEPLPLLDIKVVGKLLGCSVNDTLLASVAGALRSYLVAKGDPVDACEIRAMVPVNLRAPAASDELGNRFGLVALELPLGIENPLARLYETRARMERLKTSYQAQLTFSLLAAAGRTPKTVQEQILNLLTSKTTAVMTNVPGSPQARYFAGSRIDQQMVWVPQAGDIGIGVSILSYNGRVQFGLITDRNLVDDPGQIVDRFADEFDKLLWLLLLEPVARLDDPDAVAADLAWLADERLPGRQPA